MSYSSCLPGVRQCLCCIAYAVQYKHYTFMLICLFPGQMSRHDSSRGAARSSHPKWTSIACFGSIVPAFDTTDNLSYHRLHSVPHQGYGYRIHAPYDYRGIELHWPLRMASRQASCQLHETIVARRENLRHPDPVKCFKTAASVRTLQPYDL